MVAPLRILILEDSLSDTELMLYELYSSGLELVWRCVETEPDYLTQLEAGCDVIIADYSMPQFDAMRALQLLQERGLDTPFIVVTGSISEEVAVECMKQGAADYLLKDRLVRLGQAVIQAMQQKQLRDEKRQAVAALKESEARFRRLADNAQDIVYRYRVSPTVGFEYISPAVTAILSYTPVEHYADPYLWFKFVHEDDRQVLRQWMRAEKLTQTTILHWVCKNGTIVWTEHRNVPVYNETGRLIAIEGIARDISDRKRAEGQLFYSALHDPLTGLPNRVLFMDRLGLALEHGKRNQNYLFAVLFLDLDRFKVINDSLGHSVGDQLLIATAERLKSCLRPMDTAARFGGDEFTILLDDIRAVSDAVRVAERIQAELGLPFNLGQQEVLITVSIGITLVNAKRYNRPEELLRDADIAMYQAKTQGKARYEVFDTGMHTHAVALLQLETDLRQAIERQEFRLCYQPIVLLETSQVVGFEALLRWQHPERGLVFPAEFIPVAEETSLIIPIGEWVLREACTQLHKWQTGVPIPHLSISVNLAGKQLTQPDLSAQIHQILQETGLDALSLRLEITESAIMDTTHSVTTTLSQVRDLGIQLSIDDFGTGYSSLSRLHSFPTGALKIDRSFISQIGTEPNHSNMMIVQTIVTLAHNLGLEVIAEGVETSTQLAQLRALNCKYGQGYFFSRPLDSQAAEMLIATQPG